MVKRRESRLGGCERRILLGKLFSKRGMKVARSAWGVFVETLVLLSATRTWLSATIATATAMNQLVY